MKRKITSLTTAIIMLFLMLITWPGTMLGQSPTSVASMSEVPTSGDPTTSGGTFTKTFSHPSNKAYLQDGSSEGTEYYMQILNEDPFWTATPTSITLTANLGGGSKKDPLTNSVYVVLLDSDGDPIDGTSKVLTTKITDTGGSDFDVSFTPITGVYGVKISHVKEKNYNVRYFSFDLSYVAGSNDPSISVSPTAPSTVPCSGGSVEFTITPTNIASPSYSLQFYEAATGNTTASKPDWITNVNFVSNTLTLTIDANTGAARSAYFTVKSGDVESTSRVSINQAAITVETPEFDEDEGTYFEDLLVAITCETNGATIYYTTDGSTPAANNGTVYDGNGVSIVEGETTLKAIAIKNNVSSSVASATYTVMYPLTTMSEIFSAATTANNTPTNVAITFNDWAIVYATNNKAYMTDGQYGLVIYGSSHGFTKGKKYSGTKACKVQLYDGGSELTNLTYTQGTGLTQSDAGDLTPYSVTLATLCGEDGGQYLGSYVNLGTLTYNGSAFTDGTNTITPYAPKGGPSLPTLTNGNTYIVKGVYYIYDSGKQITQYVTNDITAYTAPAITTSPNTSLAAPNYIVTAPESAITYETITVSGTNLTNDITVALEDGASSKFEIYDATNTTWTYTLTLSPTTGTVSATAIPVRLKAGHNTGDYSDDINITSPGATAKSVSLTGSVKYAQVTYNGNGTETNVPEDDKDYTYNQEVTVLGPGSMTRTGYAFDSWNTEEEGTGTERDEDDVFNITEDVTLYAQWTVNTHTLTLPAADAYGTYTADVDDADNVEYGTKVTLTYTPAEGYENYLAQWSSSNVSIASDGTFTMPDDIVTVKVDVIPNPYIKDIVNRALTGVTSGLTTYSGWSDKSSNSSAKYAGNSAGGNDAIQLRTSSNAGVVTTTSGGKVRKVVIVWNTETTATRVIDVYGNNSAYSKVSDLYSAQSSAQGTLLGSATYKKKGDAQTDIIYITNDYAYIGIRSRNGALYIDEIQIFWEYVLPTEDGALTEDATIAENLIVHETNLTIPSEYMLTIKGTLIVSGTLTNSGDENNIYIEDGGQLIAKNAVKATVATNITNANSKAAGDHWYTISSPVNDGTNPSIPVGSVTNLTTSSALDFAYDMFSYDEENMLWLNQKNNGGASGFSVMNKGQGYLYRNSGQTLEFSGTTNYGDVSVTLSKKSDGDLSGFNLIGNPYTHDITLNYITYTGGEANLSGCLVLSNQGSWETKLGTTDKIHSRQGFLVQSDVDGKVATIHEEAQRSRSNNDYIKFVVSNSQYEDVTFALFDKGYGLNKINHRNSEIPMLYIYQNDNKYAIATMDDDTKSFNLNFKAMTMGMYTLSYEATGEFSYLHIIDRLTGADVDMLTEGEYKFVGTSTDSENRFIVRLVYSSDNEEINNDIFAYQSGNDIVVNGSGELQIFDVTGRMVSTKRVNGVETINVPSQGVYIFRLLGTEVQTQKIVIR